MRSSAPRVLTTTAVGVLLLTQTAALLLFVYHGWQVLTFPYPLDYGEGPLLDQAMRMSHFQNIYRSDLSAPPYVIANYPPLFVALQVPFAWLVGPAFWYGRALSLFSALAVVLLIVDIIRILTKDWIAAVSSGATLLAIPYMLFWAPLFRVDLLALALSWAGIWAVVRYPDRAWSVAAAALLLTAAIYTRQSYGLAAPVAACVWLLSQQLHGRAVLLVALMALVGVATFVVLTFASGGGFLFHIVTANINELGVGRLRATGTQMWIGMRYLILAGLTFLLAGYWLHRRTWWLVGPYILGAALTAATIMKVGSNVNYLLELSVALSVAVGLTMSWSRNRLVVRSALMLLLAWQTAFMVQWSRGSYYRDTMNKIAQRSEFEQLMHIVHQSDGIVLADEHMGMLPLDGRQIHFQPFEMKQLVDAGMWDQAIIIKAIEQGTFPAILIYDPGNPGFKAARWTSAMLRSLDEQYVRIGTFADTTVYQPKP